MPDLVLVDTSAWTRFLRKNPDRPDVADEVERLLTEDTICYCEPVFIELTAGARGEKELKALKGLFTEIRLKSVDARSWNTAMDTAFALGQKGFRNTPMADIIIASTAMTNNLVLFHHHPKHFKPIAQVTSLEQYSL